MSTSVFVSATMNVSSFDDWKPLFDEQVEMEKDRKKFGAIRHWMHRAVDDPSFLMVTFEFSSQDAAEQFRTYMQSDKFLERAKADGITKTPTVHILQDFEEHTYLSTN